MLGISNHYPVCFGIIIIGMKKNLANIVTVTRIIGTLALLPFDIFSDTFMAVYIWCGISDVLDGFVARKLNITSKFGSKLDSISDLLFYSVMLKKVWKYLKMYLPEFVMILIYVVIGCRVLTYALVGIVKKTFSSRHTILNKITGLLMFLLPFVVRTPYLLYYSLLILTLAYISLVDEAGYIIRKEQTA